MAKSKLVIHSANYRATSGDGKTYNVTEFMRQIITGDSLVLDVENGNFVAGGTNYVPKDPCYGALKHLQVTYSYDEEKPQIIERVEHSRMVLPEDSEVSKLTSQLAAATVRNEQLQAKPLTTQQGDTPPFSPLQKDALQLSTELLRFLKRLGPPPAPKYTEEDLDKMTADQMKVVINAQDGDYLEAFQYYLKWDGFTTQALANENTARWTRLYPWYQRLAASYALEFKDKVEQLRNRFLVAGITNVVLPSPIEGRDGEKDIRAIAAKLWELAYKAGDKGISEG
jgi:hypothetical protein